jgi:exonuclease SbcC
MRPHELTLRGFRSYRDEVTFDFRGRHLVGIVGPIGAGKSTILDAIAFALYGRTPHVHRDTKSLIHQLSDSAHVQLVFEVDGARWRSTRALKRIGAGQAKLELLGDDDEPAETITMDKPVKERIERLLGMDFDTFGRSVLLAQNEFDQFLLSSDKPRNEVLKGVFGYERFDAGFIVTKQRLAAAEATLTALEVQRGGVDEARAKLVDAEADVATASARRDAMRALAPKVREIDDAIAAAVAATADASKTLERITRAAKASPPADDVAAVHDRAMQANAAVDDAETEAVTAAAAEQQADDERTSAAEAVDKLEPFMELVRQLDLEAAAVTAAHERSERARAELHEAETAVADASEATGTTTARRADAERAEAAAREALDAADQALLAARNAEMAISLRAELVAAEPCPVCGQTVTTLPKVTKAPNLSHAEKAREKADAALRTATATRHEADAAAVRAAAKEQAAAQHRERCAAASSAADDDVQKAERALAATKSALVDRLGDGDPQAMYDESRAILRAAEEHLRSAAKEAKEARARLDAAREGRARVASAVAAIRERVVSAWAQLDTNDDLGLTDDPASLVSAHERLAVELEQRSTEASAAEAVAERAAAEARAERVALLADAELAPDVDVAALAIAAEVRAAEAEQRRDSLAAQVAEGADLDERIAEQRAERQLLTQLRDDLQPSRFLAWLLHEERAALAELASVRLEALTDGAFRFTDDETFRIVDVNAAGAERDPDSLSGGETFLASLALALALADMVTRGGGRLDSFFLDEGFGSLDPEHIDRAMAGIEHLVRDGGDRLVILVSHVPQMHEIMEDLIVLEKDEVAGSSRVLQGAAGA